MTNIIKNTLAIFASLFIVACAGVTPTPKIATQTANLPSWFLKPEASNTRYYFGVGEGANKEEARLNALTQIAGEISVSISSSVDISQILHESGKDSSYDKKVQSRTKASIEKIKFTGVKIIENVFNNEFFYVYLKVNREVLFKAQKKAMDINYNGVVSLWEYTQKSGIFEFFKNSTKIQSYIDNILPQIPILKTINPNFDDATYISTLANIEDNIRDAKSSAMVFVNTKNAAKFEDIVKKYISGYGMNLVSDLSQVKNKKNLIIIEVTKESKPKKVKSTDPRLKGASFADVVITITTLDSDRKIVARNRIKVVNISKEGYEIAAEKTAKFEREIKRKGILNILLEKISK